MGEELPYQSWDEVGDWSGLNWEPPPMVYPSTGSAESSTNCCTEILSTVERAVPASASPERDYPEEDEGNLGTKYSDDDGDWLRAGGDPYWLIGPLNRQDVIWRPEWVREPFRCHPNTFVCDTMSPDEFCRCRPEFVPEDLERTGGGWLLFRSYSATDGRTGWSKRWREDE